jgi:plasmid replication initiation protein
MKSKNLVAKKNVLVPEFVKLGHQEKRFLAYCISELNPKKETTLGRFSVNIGDIAEVFDLPRSSTYPRIREAATSINNKPIFRKEGKTHKMDFWFSWLDWEEESGEVVIQFNERLVPLLLDLQREYIQYPLSMVSDFSNKAWSLYEILKQWLTVRKKYFALDELKDALGVIGKYPRWASFKRYCLTSAIDEINKKSDIQVSYTLVKKSRKVVGLTFFINETASDDVIEDIENPLTTLEKLLTDDANIHEATASKFLKDAQKKDKVERLIQRIPKMIVLAKDKSITCAKYCTKAINDELYQRNLWGEDQSANPYPPPVADHQESLDCWQAKRKKGEECKVRKRGTPSRKKCKICFEELPIKSFGI